MPHTSFIVIRSTQNSDAAVRLQSDPILRIMKKAGAKTERMDPRAMGAIPEGACVIFHHNDRAAIKAIKDVAKSRRNVLIICLCGDIYDLSEYLSLSSFVSFFIVPTELHRKVLMSQLYTPVYRLSESVDPIAKPVGEKPNPFPIKQFCRTLWFGYPESLYKGMNSLLPLIQRSVKEGRLTSFALLLNEGDFDNRYGFMTISHSNESFKHITSKFDYTILSHFPLDLSINSYIKSPNKLITALMAGLIPICSATPSYEQIMSEHGLERFLFSSPRELDSLIRRLDPAQDSAAIAQSGIVELLEERFADAELAHQFVDVLERFQQEGNLDEFASLPEIVSVPRPTWPQVEVGLRQHIIDLIPSALRAVRSYCKRILMRRHNAVGRSVYGRLS
jgi:hypothetical protein